MIGLKARIHAAIDGADPLWFDGLAPDLARDTWSRLGKSDLGPETYSASRVMIRDGRAPKGSIMATLDWGHPVRLEPFEGAVAAAYGPLGLWAADADLAVAMEPALAKAMTVLEPALGAADAIRTLVWTVIPVAVESPDYDTGFSDPEVPFSVVLGAHDPAHGVPAIRLAEGLLHEAMHLQLSLIEAVVPLVAGARHMEHSPWQDRPRPTQGLLHGLYVFRVIEAVLLHLLDRAALPAPDADHARRRIREIRDECASLGGLRDSVDLTPVGRRLLARLLDGPAPPD